MTATLMHGIGLLVTNDPQWGGPLGELPDAAIVIEDQQIVWVGYERAAPAADLAVDLAGACVIPGFVDSHSHLIFAGDRADEFGARMNGEPYEAGGILRTVRATRQAGDDELRAMVHRLRDEMCAQGTTTFEVKSGYGLDVANEARLVRIGAEFTDEVTFLGAHVVAPEYRDNPDDYVRLVCGPMLKGCSPFVRWIDVFCERGAFDAAQSLEILRAGRDAGLGLRLHAAQLQPSEVIPSAVDLGVASIDHCTFLSDADIAALADSRTVATLLPAAEFSTRQPYPDASRLLDAGITVAMATDCNPGTAFTTSMPFCLAIGVREMHLTPQQALWSATAGGAAALRRRDIGFIRPGARADLVQLNASHWLHLMYRPGVLVIGRVWSAGRLVAGRSIV